MPVYLDDKDDPALVADCIAYAKLSSWDGAATRYIELSTEDQSRVLAYLALYGGAGEHNGSGQWRVSNMLHAARYRQDGLRRKAASALDAFIATIDDTGGIFRDRRNYPVPVADEEWIDLGEAYLLACAATNRQPKTESPGDDA